MWYLISSPKMKFLMFTMIILATTQEFYHVFADEEGSGENDGLHFQLFKYLKEWERTSNVLLVGGR